MSTLLDFLSRPKYISTFPLRYSSLLTHTTQNIHTHTSPLSIINQDRSDEEESDHHPDPYAPTRGRVSPSPYTANTERARQFNVCNFQYLCLLKFPLGFLFHFI